MNWVLLSFNLLCNAFRRQFRDSCLDKSAGAGGGVGSGTGGGARWRGWGWDGACESEIETHKRMFLVSDVSLILVLHGSCLIFH